MWGSSALSPVRGMIVVFTVSIVHDDAFAWSEGKISVRSAGCSKPPSWPRSPHLLQRKVSLIWGNRSFSRVQEFGDAVDLHFSTSDWTLEIISGCNDRRSGKVCGMRTAAKRVGWVDRSPATQRALMASSWRPPPTDHNHHDRRETKQDPESCRQDYLSWTKLMTERCSRSSLYLPSKPSILFGQKNFARSSWISLFRLYRNGQWLLCIERRSRLSSSFQFSLRVWPQIAMAAFIELSKSTVTALEKGIINADHVADDRNCCGLHCRPQQFRCLCFNFSLPVGLHSILNFHRIPKPFFCDRGTARSLR